ncbi:MAG: HAD-IB family phosphatase [Candidatus Methylopumilus sp.]|jgi:2,3-diketo-5-methylthio-1-phosphopentane phosphatase
MLFIIDFDGTLSIRDTVDAMLERFADDSWQSIEQDWLDGKISAVECMTQQIRMVKADHVTLEGFFRSISLDTSFLPFYRHISQFSRIAIVSDGLDHAVKIAMRSANMPDIPVYANHLHFIPQGIDISFPNRVAGCEGGNGTCKCAIARNLSLESGGPVVLVGDGKSDACLSRHADIVFAKGKLIKHCEQENISHHTFHTFSDVLAKILGGPSAWPQGYAHMASGLIA